MQLGQLRDYDTYYVYLIIGDDGSTYIGKHYQPANKKDYYKGSGTILRNKLAKHGHEYFEKYILFETSNKNQINDYERYFIALFRSFKLADMNILDGGDGVSSEQVLGQKNPMYGKNAFANKTPEEMAKIKENMSKGHSGIKNSMYGKNAYANKTPEELEKINAIKSYKNKQAWARKSPEQKRNQIEKRREKLKSYFQSCSDEQKKHKVQRWKESYNKFLNDESRKTNFYLGHIKQKEKLKGKRKFTNGVIDKMFYPGEEPEGFVRKSSYKKEHLSKENLNIDKKH